MSNSYDVYAALLNKKLVIPSAKTPYVAVHQEHWVSVLAPHIARIWVDEEWYLARYIDVKEAVINGSFASGREHYAKVGYFEHRMPHAIEVEEAWYLQQYPDVNAAVIKGLFPSGEAHFSLVGFREGRLPRARFQLASAE